MVPFYSKFEGNDFDKAIEWVLQQMENSTTQTLESSPDNKIDLNTLTYQQGTYIIQYFDEGYEGTSASTDNPIELKVIVLDDNTVIQRYEVGGNTVQRIYDKSTDTWTEWKPVQSFVVAEESESVSVGVDTIVLRKIESPVENYFQNDTTSD